MRDLRRVVYESGGGGERPDVERHHGSDHRAQVSLSSTFGTLVYDQSVTGTSASVPGLAGKTTHFCNATETSAGPGGCLFCNQTAAPNVL